MILMALSFPTALDVRTLAADASLLLLVGGLAMMSVIMLLVIIQNLVPDRTPTGNLGLGGGRGSDAVPRLWPRRAPRPAATPAIDKVMVRIAHLRLGEPRILQARSRTTRVRLYSCPGCSFELEEGVAEAKEGCVKERTGVEQAFRDVYGGKVSVWEASCRLRGDGSCEFEVTHGPAV